MSSFQLSLIHLQQEKNSLEKSLQHSEEEREREREQFQLLQQEKDKKFQEDYDEIVREKDQKLSEFQESIEKEIEETLQTLQHEHQQERQIKQKEFEQMIQQKVLSFPFYIDSPLEFSHLHFRINPISFSNNSIKKRKTIGRRNFTIFLRKSETICNGLNKLKLNMNKW